MIVNNELDRMWKKVAMAYYKIVTPHWPEGTKENCKSPQS
jgi:hypothetical protein